MKPNVPKYCHDCQNVTPLIRVIYVMLCPHAAGKGRLPNVVGSEVWPLKLVSSLQIVPWAADRLSHLPEVHKNTHPGAPETSSEG